MANAQYGNLNWKGDPCQPKNGAPYYWDSEDQVWYYFYKDHWRRVSDDYPVD